MKGGLHNMRDAVVAVIACVLAIGVAGVSLMYHYSPGQPSGFNYQYSSWSWTLIAFVPQGEDPEYRSLLRASVAAVESLVPEGITFSTVGVDLGWDNRRGVKNLGYYGPFDEIIAGRNWLNTAAVAYMWRDLPGMAAIPAVLLIAEPLRVQPTYHTVGAPLELVRVIGTDGLQAWEARQFLFSWPPTDFNEPPDLSLLPAATQSFSDSASQGHFR